MEIQKSQALIDLYPELFQCENPKEPFFLFGFECDDGWFELLSECILEIRKVCEKYNLSIRAEQVKEKYGTLRVHLSSVNDEIYEILEKFNYKSSKTCELCGKEGELKDVHVLKTLCQRCFIKYI